MRSSTTVFVYGAGEPVSCPMQSSRACHPLERDSQASGSAAQPSRSNAHDHLRYRYRGQGACTMNVRTFDCLSLPVNISAITYCTDIGKHTCIAVISTD